MDALETLEVVRRQYLKLRYAGLKPTTIIVGEETFMAFIRDVKDHMVVHDALGHRGPATMMGLRLFRTFEDQPFTVLTDGSRDI